MSSKDDFKLDDAAERDSKRGWVSPGRMFSDRSEVPRHKLDLSRLMDSINSADINKRLPKRSTKNPSAQDGARWWKKQREMEHLTLFCSSSCQFAVLFMLRFVWWQCQEENILPAWLYNSHSVSAVFYYFIGRLFKTPWISSWNRLSFCFAVTKACRYRWARNYPLGFCVNVFVGKKAKKQMLVWRCTEVNMVWSIGATKERSSKQYYAIIVADHDIPVVQKAGTVRYLCMWKPSFAVCAAVFTSCSI